jgi:hypothetical protein
MGRRKASRGGTTRHNVLQNGRLFRVDALLMAPARAVCLVEVGDSLVSVVLRLRPLRERTKRRRRNVEQQVRLVTVSSNNVRALFRSDSQCLFHARV